MPLSPRRDLLAISRTMDSTEQLRGRETGRNDPARITMPRPDIQRKRVQNIAGGLALAARTVRVSPDLT